MMKEKNRKDYYKILIPMLILVFFPFPSKIIGYSGALYVSDFVLMIYLIISCIKNKYKISINNSFIILMLFLFMNVMGIFIGILNNGADWRQCTELIRTFEWIIIYIYIYNTIKSTTDETDKVENDFLKAIFLILTVSIVFVVIELFNLPPKSILRNLYELGKSGNIFQYYNRIVGTFRNPNMFGIWMIIALASILVSNYKITKKIIFLLISIGIIYFTGSRTGIIIAIIIILFVYLLQYLQRKNNKRKIQNLLIIIMVLIIGCMIIKENSELFYSIRLTNWENDIADLNGRTQIWGKYNDSIDNNLLLGNGIIKDNDIVFDNAYIQYMYYYGITGIVILCVLFIKNLNKTIVIYRKEENKNFILLILAIQIIVIISGITIQILDSLQIFYFYIFAMAYIDNKYSKNENSKIPRIKNEDTSNNF